VKMARITINNLKIENFGPYKQRQEINLAVSPSRPIILVKALNGSGKTTLLGALQVCLYGHRAMHLGRRSQFDQYVTSLLRADATGPATLEVSLSVQTGAAEREMRVAREYGRKGTAVTEKLTVWVNGVVDPAAAEGWDDFIESILPAELLQLFFFDGEKIESLANPERLPDLLRRATEVFLGIGGIDAAVGDLRAAERRILLKNRGDGDEFAKARTSMTDLEAQCDELRGELQLVTQTRGKAQNDLDQAQLALSRYVEQSKRSGLMSFEAAANLKARVADATEESKQARTDLANLLSDPFVPIAWVSKLWSRYRETWSEEHHAADRVRLAKELKDHDSRVLAQLKSPDARGALEEIRAVMREDLSRFSGRSRPPVFIQGADPTIVEDRVNASLKAIRGGLASIDGARRSLDDAELQIRSLPTDDELGALVSGLSDRTKRVADAEASLGQSSIRIDELQSHISHLEMKVNAARTRLSGEFRDRLMEAKAIEAAMRAKQVLTAFKEKLLASKAAWLSDMITSEFRRLMRKKRLVSRVDVDPATYRVTIRSGASELPMDRLSAGERQLLATSILSALIKERKGRFPVVVDTPLARLDGEHRQSLVRHFFATVSHQVLVLSTDEEVAGETYDTLKSAMSSEYLLQFDDTLASTQIVPKMTTVKVVA
jgi:DNA sulfur modification protein DndD